MTKLVLISDTHGKHHGMPKIPLGDVLIHAGDFSHGDIGGVDNFLRWFSRQPHPHKVFIAGNHDALCETAPALFQRMLKDFPHLTYLQDSGATICGLKFWGSPVTPPFMQWHFMRERGAVIKRHWDMIPEGTDVLVTHGPPKRFHDWSDFGNEHCGCADLWDAIRRVGPHLHVFGHIHGGYGQTKLSQSKREMLLVNASVCDEGYNPRNPAQVVELR